MRRKIALWPVCLILLALTLSGCRHDRSITTPPTAAPTHSASPTAPAAPVEVISQTPAAPAASDETSAALDAALQDFEQLLNAADTLSDLPE